MSYRVRIPLRRHKSFSRNVSVAHCFSSTVKQQTMSSAISYLFSRTVLNPGYPLRRQLFLSFGLPYFLSIAAVVSLAITFAYHSGSQVREAAREALQRQEEEAFVRSSSYVADQATEYMYSTEGSLQILIEAVKDRFAGYSSNDNGWTVDAYVPFQDETTGKNVYPLKAPPPILRFNFTSNINANNIGEHLQARLESTSDVWALKHLGRISTAYSSLWIQGVCDPSQLETGDRDCYSDRYNVSTEYKEPTKTAKYIYEKGEELCSVDQSC